MTAGVQCRREDQNVGDVLKDMGDQQIRRLPVVDAEQRLVGIVSIGDLSREAKPCSGRQVARGHFQADGALTLCSSPRPAAADRGGEGA